MAPVMGCGRLCLWRESGVCSQAVGFVLARLTGIILQSP
jgi:hypothetical protein